MVAEGLTDAQIVERLLRLERNVAMLAAEAGIEIEDPSPRIDADVLQLARSGDRMGAAKLLAERTGASFIEAQRTVNSL
jgi:hypothetical protein